MMNHVPPPSPKTSDDLLEHAIKRAGADKAPRITLSDVGDSIASVHYFTAADGVDGAGIAALRAQDQSAPLTLQPMADDPQIWRMGGAGPLNLLTFCVVVMKNGFTVTGESACASPENFNAEIGKRIARENAVAKIWPLLGYELRSKLAA